MSGRGSRTKTLVAAALLAFASGMAAGQPAQQAPTAAESAPHLVLNDVHVLQRTTPNTFVSLYPQRALQNNVTGQVALSCLIGGDGRLQCRVEDEEPAGYGFGPAALLLSRSFQIGPTTRAGDPAAGQRLRFSYAFRIPENEVSPSGSPGLSAPAVATSPDILNAAQFIQRPTARDFEAVYPEAALRERLSGRGTLGCTVLRDGRLECLVLDEAPAGYGFGAAALALAPKFLVRVTAGDGTSTVGKIVRIPIMFRIA